MGSKVRFLRHFASFLRRPLIAMRRDLPAGRITIDE
jgi:hypothetical protein